MLKVRITYPEPHEERQVLDRALGGADAAIHPVLTIDQIQAMREVVELIYIDEQMKDYMLAIVRATREPAQFGLSDLRPLIDFGVSPRATIYLGIGARAVAFLNGRGYVTPQDVKDIAPDVLRHRLVLSYEAEAEQQEADDVIQRILNAVPVP